MRIKFLNLHTIPWCFHLMGNVSCMHLQPEAPASSATIKLITSDGIVKIYDRPIHVSELMLEFPKHLVCRSDSFYIGQKIPALAEDEELELGNKYFLLPKHFFQSVLSFVTVASFASSQSHPSPVSSSLMARDSKTAFLKKAASCRPFDIQKTPSGCLRIRVSDEFIAQLMEEGKMKDEEEEGVESSSGKSKSRVCTTPQLEKDYTQLVGSRQWKPKLETIRENEKRKLSSFGMKRRKKSQNKANQKAQRSEQHLHSTSVKAQRSEQHLHSTSVKAPSKAKIKRSRK